MCGIIGAWSDTAMSEAALREGLAALFHRGPDDAGMEHLDSVWLAMRRLSIIDVSTGHQPISNEDASIWVVCNGEIYNYQELTQGLLKAGHRFRTKSDTEVLVHLYEEYGVGMFERLRGMFALAIYDGRNQRLLLARDRFGKKPLYFARSPDGGLFFASELKALRPLARAVGLPLRTNPQAIYDYLSLGVVPQPSTIYERVEAVPMGSWLQFDGSRTLAGRYWDVDFSRIVERPYDEAVELVRAVVSDATRLRLRSDVPLGVFLSSGVDSSVVAYEASRHLSGTLRTFTIGVDAPDLDESTQARATAAALGAQHADLPLRIEPLEGVLEVVRAYDQPFWDSSAIPSLAVARLAREHVTVVLSGDGGDELFAGYRHHFAPWLADHIPGMPSGVYQAAKNSIDLLRPERRSALGFAQRLVSGLPLGSGGRHLRWSSELLGEAEKQAVWLGGATHPTEAWIEALLPRGLSSLRTHLQADILINLHSDMLVKLDIASMAASLEVRCPLLDQELADLVFTLPDHFLIGLRGRKRLLRDAYRGRLSAAVLDGRKRGFEVPIAAWMSGPLREITHDVIGARDSRLRQWLRGDFLESLLCDRTPSARSSAQVLYALLIVELWLREYA